MKKLYFSLIAALFAVCFTACEEDNLVGTGGIQKTISIISSDVLFDCDAASGSIVYEAEGPVSVTCDKTWCTINVSGNTISVSVGANEDIMGRTAVVKLTSGAYSVDAIVQQKGKVVLFDFYGATFEVGQGGKTITVEGTSTGALTAESNVDWITTSVADNIVTIEVAKNTKAAERTGKVTVSAPDYNRQGVYTIVQEAGASPVFEGTYTLDFFSDAAESVAETITATVTADASTENLYHISGILKDVEVDIPATLNKETNQLHIANAIEVGTTGNYHVATSLYYTKSDGSSNYYTTSTSTNYDIIFDIKLNEETNKYEWSLYQSGALFNADRVVVGFWLYRYSQWPASTSDTDKGSLQRYRKPKFTQQ